MEGLRFSIRHLHQTVADHIEAGLTALDWFTAGQVPFGAPPLVLSTSVPDTFEEMSQWKAGRIAVTLGGEPPATGEEIGGPLSRVEMPVFVDVFMDNARQASCVTEDVRDLLQGKIPGFSPVVPLYDYTQDPRAATPARIRFEDIEREQNPQMGRWWMLKAIAAVEFRALTLTV